MHLIKRTLKKHYVEISEELLFEESWTIVTIQIASL